MEHSAKKRPAPKRPFAGADSDKKKPFIKKPAPDSGAAAAGGPKKPWTQHKKGGDHTSTGSGAAGEAAAASGGPRAAEKNTKYNSKIRGTFKAAHKKSAPREPTVPLDPAAQRRAKKVC